MGLSAQGRRDLALLQRTLKTTNTRITWDVEEENGTDAIIVVNVGEVTGRLTDMDYDVALNDPSRLVRHDTPPESIYRVKITLGKYGWTSAKILEKVK